ncbi:adipolin-like [Mytilus galloprovincialis]|uniref:adipolin-like n=1 Tax=Mytilus galloprovincialis TaxID=29158 RepID=UPI003F7CB159
MVSISNVTFVIFVTFLTIGCIAKNKNNDYQEQAADSFSNLSANDEELDTVRRKNVNAQDSWFTFVRHSKRPQNNKQPRKRKEKKSKRLACAHGCVPGPAGPRGPPGPPGPAGAVITKEILMQEFKELVREAAERRALELLAEKCPSCTDNLNITSSSIPVSTKNNAFDSVARIAVGFNMRLRRNVAISGRTFMELGAFHQPFAAGSFNRGENFNIKNGRFGAPKSGIYQFSVNLHMRIKRNGRRLKLRKQDNIRAQICIDSLCQKYASLQHISGLESNSKFFTVSFMGFLELTAGQYASVYVDNASRVNIIVQTTSDFSGILVGL